MGPGCFFLKFLNKPMKRESDSGGQKYFFSKIRSPSPENQLVCLFPMIPNLSKTCTTIVRPKPDSQVVDLRIETKIEKIVYLFNTVLNAVIAYSLNLTL